MLDLGDLLLLGGGGGGPPPTPPRPDALTFEFTLRASETSSALAHSDNLTFDLDVTSTAPITPDDEWWAQLVDMHGTVLARLAEPRFSSSITETLNDAATAQVTISPTVDAAAWAIIKAAYPLPEVEIQVFRGDRLWFWGPLTDRDFDSDSGTLVLPATDAMWHLDHRVMGRLGAQYGGYNPELLPHDKLINPTFADGLTGWNQLHFTSYTLFPGFDVVDPAVVTVQPDSGAPPPPTPGARVIKFDTPLGDPSNGYGLYQVLDIQSGVTDQGIKIQASCYFWLPAGDGTAPTTQRVALQVSRLPRSYSAPVSFYTEVIDQSFAVIGDAFARGQWVLLETPPLSIPTALFESLAVTFYPPQGVSYMCVPEGPLRAADEAMEAVGYDPSGPYRDASTGVEVNSIAAILVLGAQDEARGGSGDLNMTCYGTPYGSPIVRIFPHQQHQHFGDAIRQLSKDGYYDWRWLLTQTTRAIVTARRQGSYRPRARIVCTDEMANVNAVKQAVNWSAGATAVAVQSQGKLMPHEAAANIPGVFQIQDVHVAERNDEPFALPLRAREHLATVSRPEVLTVTTEPDGVHLLTLDVGDWTDVVVDVPGAYAMGIWRVVRKETSPETRCAVLTLNPFTP